MRKARATAHTSRLRHSERQGQGPAIKSLDRDGRTHLFVAASPGLRQHTILCQTHRAPALSAPRKQRRDLLSQVPSALNRPSVHVRHHSRAATDVPSWPADL